MVDRQLFGDLVLAVTLVLPTAALAHAEMANHPAQSQSSAAAKAAPAERAMDLRGVSLLG
jgi:hypothetical protein